MREKRFKLDKNQVEFVHLVLGRVAPGLVARIVNDETVSLYEEIEIRNPKTGKSFLSNSLLFIERYERHGVNEADKFLRSEIDLLGIIPPAPSVSTGKGIPATDPFAQPTGLAGADRLPSGQTPDKQ